MKQHLILFVFVVLAFNSPVFAQWPQWRGPMRNGVSPETNLLKSWPKEGPKLLWSCDIGMGYSSAVIQDQRIYITGTKETNRVMTVMDLHGTTIWEKTLGDSDSEDKSGECSTPTLHEGKIYSFTGAGNLYCLEAKDGTVDWVVNIPERFGQENHFCESPLVVDDTVIMSPYGKITTIVALNRLTGETLWQSECIEDSTAYVSPLLVQGQDKKIVVTNGRKHVLAVDLATGKIVWKGDISAESFVPIPAAHQIYIPSGMMLTIDPDQTNVDTPWQDNQKINVFGGGVKLGDRIYATFENSSGLICLDWQTGQQVALNKSIKGGCLIAADGMIYSYEDKRGRVSLIKPLDDAMEIVSSFRVRQGEGRHLAHMSIGHGILFIRHGDVLMAYDIQHF